MTYDASSSGARPTEPAAPASVGASARVEHLSMRFRRPRRRHDLSFNAARGDITALIGPNGAGRPPVSTDHRLLQADRGAHCAAIRRRERLERAFRPDRTRQRAAPRGPAARSFLLERMPDYLVTPKGARRPHLPEHPPVPRHDGLGEFARCPAQRADACLGLYRARCARLSLLRGAERAAIEKARYWLDRTGLGRAGR